MRTPLASHCLKVLKQTSSTVLAASRGTIRPQLRILPKFKNPYRIILRFVVAPVEMEVSAARIR